MHVDPPRPHTEPVPRVSVMDDVQRKVGSGQESLPFRQIRMPPITASDLVMPLHRLGQDGVRTGLAVLGSVRGHVETARDAQFDRQFAKRYRLNQVHWLPYGLRRGTGFQPVAGYGLEARATLGCGRSPSQTILLYIITI